MLEITSHRNGEVLTSRNGKETSGSLAITIRGISTPQSVVTINGVRAERNDREFTAEIELTEKINVITARSRDKFGERTQSITLVWDKASYKRYAVRIDDNVFFFTDLAREKPKSLFDHFYIRELKRLHDTYGSKFILKCFYSNDHDTAAEKFNLSMMPDTYKGEFEECASWLHFAFHARSEFPDRPYQHTSRARLKEDFELTYEHLERIVGKNAVTPPTNVHWAMLSPEHFPFMREKGVKILTSSGFMSNRIIVDGKVEDIQGNACDIGFFYEQDVAHHMVKKRCYYDPDYDLFLSRTFFCFNIDTPEEIEEKIRKEDALASCDMLECIGHEQYAYPRYEMFLPDYFKRLETCCRIPSELGYKPVFFQDGIFGNTAWGK